MLFEGILILKGKRCWPCSRLMAAAAIDGLIDSFGSRVSRWAAAY